MSDASPAPGSAPLNGWKDIAAYMGRSVRAVQRWESELGFPVHRIKTASGQTVYAFREEIDEWRFRLDAGPKSPETPADSTDLPDPGPPTSSELVRPTVPVRSEGPLPGPKRRWFARSAGFLLSVGLVTTVVLLFSSMRDVSRGHDVEPYSTRWNGRVLETVDSGNRLLWSHSFDREISTPYEMNVGQFIFDLDGDGRSEVLVPVRFGSVGSKVATTDAVLAFGHDGELRWTIAPDLTVTCGTESFSGPWDLRALDVSDGPGPRRVWLVYVHHTWRPSFVLEVAPDGRSEIRYTQAGWIFTVTDWITPAGRLLAAGGILNEYKRASIALIDLAGPPGRSPAGTVQDSCSDADTTPVQRVLLLPPLETTVVDLYDFVTSVRIVGPDLKVSYGWAKAILRLTPDLRIAEYALADSYFVRHRELEQMGKLDHPAERCPFVTAEKEIREWTSAADWGTHMIRPLAR